MPGTRKSTRTSSGNPLGRQSTLAFNNARVTKNTSKPVDKDLHAPAKNAIHTEPSTEEIKPEPTTPITEPVVLRAATPEPTKAEPKTSTPKAVKSSPKKVESEVRADKINDAQIKRYWSKVEAQRRAPRVHQSQLSLGEKVLRYFDVSSQFGPCIGIPRMQRWQRAERLGLNPPIEVLAVLRKEEKKGNSAFEVAEMERIMGSTAVGAC